tara:strand:+ start:103 stop:888 length:786 start_codon:yes stop_codon:yes gene_type:complete
MRKLTQKEKKFFVKNGYLHLKSIISNKKISNFKRTFFDLFHHYSGFNSSKNFNDPNLVKMFKKFRNKNKKNFFYFFRTVSLTSTFNDLYTDNILKELAGNLLKTNKLNLIIAEPQLRIDEPNDKSFVLDWHQDAAHYAQDPTGKNSLVFNITVQKITEEMGSVKLKVGSHKKGIYKFSNLKKIKKSKVLQLMPNKKNLKNNNFKTTFLNSNPGDIIIYDMRLLHKSGINSSNKIRLSVISRAFNPMVKSFRSFRYLTQILN